MVTSKIHLSNEIFSYSSYLLLQTNDKSIIDTWSLLVGTENDNIYNTSISTLILPAKTPILLTVGHFLLNLLTSTEKTELFNRKHIKLQPSSLRSKIRIYLYHNEKLSASNENSHENYIELEPSYLLFPKDLAESFAETFKANSRISNNDKIDPNNPPEITESNWTNTFLKSFTLLVLQPLKANFLAGKFKEEQILNISEEPTPGQTVYPITSPFALLSPILYKNTVNVTTIAKVTHYKYKRLRGRFKRSFIFLVNTTAKEGEEGAPIFNEFSEVIGILLGNIAPDKKNMPGYSVCLSTSSIVDLLSLLSLHQTNSDVWKLTASKFRPFIQSLSAKSLLPRIVKVLTGSALATGILLSSSGFILTTKSVVSKSLTKKIVIEINFNSSQTDYEFYDTEVFQVAEGNVDIALLKVTTKLSERVVKAVKATEKFLEHPIDIRYLHNKEVYAIGYTFNEFKGGGFRTVVTRGNLHKVIVYRNTPFLIGTTCPVYGGFSGGAIVSDRGEFLGLIVYLAGEKKRGQNEEFNLAFSSNFFKEMISMMDSREEEEIKKLEIWKMSDGYVQKKVENQVIEPVQCFDFKPKL